MKTSIWAPYISDHTIQAICWMLIHSLWIGVVAALLAGAVITLTRKSKPDVRYRLLCGIMVLFALAVSITFYIQARTVDPKPLPADIKTFVVVDSHGHPFNVTPAHLGFYEGFVSLIKQNTNLIFMVWLLLFLFKSFKMVGGLLYIQRIRNYKVHEVPEEFKYKIGQFASQIGISQAVRLMQSELVKVPVAVGWLKPVILLPIGIILQLPAEQVESILWHELAHIRRRDYLVNILQGLVETVFFFNPGLLWLSSLIRAEREACCDDIVLSRTSRKTNYLEALLAFNNDNFRSAKLAMSMGSGSQLRDRLKRMIHQENKRLSIVEKVVLVAGLVVLSAFTGLRKTTKQAVQHLVNVMRKKPVPAVTHKATVIDSEKKQLVILPQKMKIAVVDTPKITVDTPVRFTSILFKLSDADLNNNDITAQDAKGKKYHFIVAEGKLTDMDINGEKVQESDFPKYEYMLAEIDRTIAQKRGFQDDGAVFTKPMSPARKFKMDKGFVKMRDGDTIKFKQFSQDFKPGTLNPRFKMQGPNMKFVNPKMDGFYKKLYAGDSNYNADIKRMNNIIADLVAEKIVAKAGDVKWFGLSDTEFIVNGQKQPDEMQQRYKAKYGVHENYGLYYGPAKMTGTGVFIDPTERNGRGLRAPVLREQEAFKTQQFNQKQLFLEDKQLRMKQFNMQGVKPRFMASQIPLQDIVASIADELVKDNIVKDKSDLQWFNLTNTSLVVNGKTQSEEVHQKLKEKYLKEGQYPLDDKATDNPNFGLHYNLKTGSMGLGIMDGDKGD